MGFRDRKNWVFALAAGFLFAAFFIQGCAENSDLGKDVLATVNNDPVTVEDFKITVGIMPSTYDDKKTQLWSIINKRILAKEAAASGVDNDLQVVADLEKFYDDRLPDVLRMDVYKKATVEQSELDAIRKSLNFKPLIHANVMVTENMESAEAAIAEIKKGATFEQAAAKYSMIRGDVNRDISLDDSLYPVGVRAVMNRMKPGELAPAMKSDIGYMVIKVLSKDEPDALWQAREKEEVDNLKRQKMEKEMADILARRRASAKIEITSEKNDRGETIYTGATVNGLKIALDPRLYKKQPDENYHAAHQNFNAATLQAALNNKIKDILYTAEAKERGLDKDPNFQKDLKLKKEEALADNYLNKMVGGNEASQKEIADYYEKYKKEISGRTMVRVSHILLPTEDKAKETLEELKKGKDFAKLAKERTMDQPTKDNGGDVGFIDPEGMKEPMKSALMGMKPGDISGVIKSPMGYEIVKVTEKKGQQAPALADVQDKMRKMVTLEKRSERVEELYKKLYEKYKVKVNEKLLKSL